MVLHQNGSIDTRFPNLPLAVPPPAETTPMIICSNDYVLFGAPSKALCKASPIFLIEFSLGRGSVSYPMFLEASSSVVNIFLSLINDSLPQKLSLSLQQTFQLYELSRRFDCLHDTIMFLLHQLAAWHPLEVLEYATQRGDASMARIVIRRIGTKCLGWQLWGVAEALFPRDWKLALRRATFFALGKPYGKVFWTRALLHTALPWDIVADRFRP